MVLIFGFVTSIKTGNPDSCKRVKCQIKSRLVHIRRFRMLSDALVLEKLHFILDETWDQYPNLHDSEEELKTVSAFARILEGLIKETSKHPHNTAIH